MSRLRPEQDQCTGRVNAPVISIDMQYNTPKLSFKPIADDISPLIKISMSQEFDNGDHLLMGEGPCHFYLSCLDCDGKNSLARLCCDGANQLLAAFHLSLVEGSLTIKRASKAVAEDVLREIVDEVIRIVRKRDSLRSIYVSALPLLTEYIAFLRKCGFVEDSADGVYFEYDLRDEIPSSTVPNEVTIRDLDVLNEVEMRSRAIAQSSAFSDKDLESMGDEKYSKDDRIS